MNIPHLVFSPFIPLWALGIAALLGLVLALWGARGGTRAFLWRFLPLAALILALANPRLTEEQSTSLNDVAVVLVDDSPSMAVGDRHAQSEATLAAITERLKRLPGLDVKVEHYHSTVGRDEGTKLFGALDRALADVPRSRLAGVLAITDGEVHDVPDHADLSAPLHVLIAGHHDERDRRLVIEQAPAFGIVGKNATMTFRVEDPGQTGSAQVNLRKDGGAPTPITVPINTSSHVDIPLDHAGSNIVEMDTPGVPGELTLVNNRAATAITGVRDRLRVLLVSGEPHAGERTWRNLLKADPSVDLVHFTILRPPDKEDGTPLRELALISFPTRELFEEKLKDFDLIILDRYRRRVALLPSYYQNIVNYVRNGGALLVAAGPEFSAQDTLYTTALGTVLPVAPAKGDLEQRFTPEITALGKRHPVTSGLPGADTNPPHWGPWMRVVGGRMKGDGGDVVMSGPDNRPLLILNHVGQGRVAELMSDTVWLWSRDFEGGGPQAELLRRLAHWLMKEPELEENQLIADIRGNTLMVRRRSLKPDPAPVTVTAPDGTQSQLPLEDHEDGTATARMGVEQEGLWRVGEGDRVALAAAGVLNPVEMTELRATDARMKKAADATGGGLAWIADGLPDLRRVEPGATTANGSRWFGFRANHDRIVTALSDTPLMPWPLLLLFGFGGLALAWWREGK